jgi:hypothetical protein
MPPLLALYAGTLAPPKKLSMDAMFTMQPRERIRWGFAATETRIAPIRFTSIT